MDLSVNPERVTDRSKVVPKRGASMCADATQSRSRRRFLSGLAAGAAAGMAGCGSLVGGDDLAATATAELSAPTRGAEDAPVTVEVYEDFACPACGRFAEVLAPQIASEYVEPGVARYQFHDMPLDTHAPASYEAANAARAVQDSVDDAAFFEYADLLFANQSDLGPALYEELASEVGADGESVREAATGRTYRNVVNADKRAGIDRGVDATPTVFVDDSAVDELSWAAIRQAIEAARPDG